MFRTVDIGKGWDIQVFPCAIGGITTCHKMIHSLSLPTVTDICMRDLPRFHHGPTSSFLYSPPIHAPPGGLCRRPSVHLGRSLCHTTQLIVNQGCSMPLPTMWYQHLVLLLRAHSQMMLGPDITHANTRLIL